jgi:hypothetical protein
MKNANSWVKLKLTTRKVWKVQEVMCWDFSDHGTHNPPTTKQNMGAVAPQHLLPSHLVPK